MSKFYFTSESVTEGHPDKLCDTISDAILDECLRQDENSRVAVETFASNNLITVAGQITTNAVFDIEALVRDIIKEPIIINQTTLSFLELNNIHKEILENIPKANIIDEICPVTRIRQENIINLKKDYDLLIIIGSKTSSNTNKLYELALKYHQNKKVLMIGSKKDLFNFDLSNYKHVAIFSGTSTPNEIINEVKQYLEEEYSL